jgi:hypothetical protein
MLSGQVGASQVGQRYRMLPRPGQRDGGKGQGATVKNAVSSVLSVQRGKGTGCAALGGHGQDLLADLAASRLNATPMHPATVACCPSAGAGTTRARRAAAAALSCTAYSVGTNIKFLCIT